MEPAFDHRAFVRSLSSQQRQSLVEKSNKPALVRLAIHLNLIALLMIAVWSWPVVWFYLVLPLGVLLVFLFPLQHETVHRTAFNTPWINDFVAHATGFVIVMPAVWFRYFHFAHHRHTQDTEKDPELASPKPETLLDYFRHVSGVPYWWGTMKVLAGNTIGQVDDSYVTRAATAQVISESRAYLFGYGLLFVLSITFQSAILLWLWVIPLMVGQPILRLYLLAEHGRCATVENMLENSRTTFTNRIVRWFAWNMPYHAEHHTMPAVPFHKLPELHELTKSHLLKTEPSYVAFHQKYVQAIQSDIH